MNDSQGAVRAEVQASLSRIRAEAFELLEILRNEGLTRPHDELCDVLVALQSVANQLGRLEARAGAEDFAATERSAA